MIHQSGFPVHELEPRLTEEKAEHLVQVDRMEKKGDFFEVDQNTSIWMPWHRMPTVLCR